MTLWLKVNVSDRVFFWVDAFWAEDVLKSCNHWKERNLWSDITTRIWYSAVTETIALVYKFFLIKMTNRLPEVGCSSRMRFNLNTAKVSEAYHVNNMLPKACERRIRTLATLRVILCFSFTLHVSLMRSMSSCHWVKVWHSK